MGLKVNTIKPVFNAVVSCAEKSAVKSGSIMSCVRPNPVNKLCTNKSFTFDDIYSVTRIKNGRLRIIPKFSNVNGKQLHSFEMPEYLYHVTNEEKMKLINATRKIKVSENEQLPGIYLLDKENFLKNYINVSDENYNLINSMIKHANDNNKSGNLVLIRIPTANLLKNGKMRIRTQEDFFYFQNKIRDLQKGLKKKHLLRMFKDDTIRNDLKKHIIDNRLMTNVEAETFFAEMKSKIHYGYGIEQFEKLENNKAVEFIFNRDITPDLIKGIKIRKFSIDECYNSDGTINIEKLRAIFE